MYFLNQNKFHNESVNSFVREPEEFSCIHYPPLGSSPKPWHITWVVQHSFLNIYRQSCFGDMHACYYLTSCLKSSKQEHLSRNAAKSKFIYKKPIANDMNRVNFFGNDSSIIWNWWILLYMVQTFILHGMWLQNTCWTTLEMPLLLMGKSAHFILCVYFCCMGLVLNINTCMHPSLISQKSPLRKFSLSLLGCLIF